MKFKCGIDGRVFPPYHNDILVEIRMPLLKIVCDFIQVFSRYVHVIGLIVITCSQNDVFCLVICVFISLTGCFDKKSAFFLGYVVDSFECVYSSLLTLSCCPLMGLGLEA